LRVAGVAALERSTSLLRPRGGVGGSARFIFVSIIDAGTARSAAAEARDRWRPQTFRSTEQRRRRRRLTARADVQERAREQVRKRLVGGGL
jgi:hypothetical protein